MKSIIKSNFTKSILLIAGGTAFAQLVNALLSPIITRIYLPEQYGVLTIYIAILGMLSIIGSLKYEWGIPIADDDKKAINVLSLSVGVLIIVTLILSIIFYFVGEYLLGLIHGKALIKYKYLIPIGVFFAGLYNIIMQWTFRKKDFKSISKTKVSQTITQNIIIISFGLLKFGPVGLILGRILGESAGITTLSKQIIKKEKNILKNINKKDIIWSAKRYIRFPVFSAPSQFLNTAGMQLPVLFITLLYGSDAIGFYGLANGIVNLPMNLIGRSVGDVFYGEAASIGRVDPDRLKKLSNKLFKKLILIGLVPLVILVIFGPFLFSIVFGSEWYEAGIYARIIAFLVFSRLIFTPISRVYVVFERQKEDFCFDLLRVILVFIVFEICKIMSLNSYWAIGLYSIAMSIIYLITFLYAQKIINDQIKIINYKKIYKK